MQLFGDRKLKEYEEAVKKNPSPLTYMNLVKYLQSKGNEVKAVAVLEKAVKELPDSDQLFAMYFPYLKNKLQPEIKKLREVIETRPNVVAFSQLAEIYKDLREEDEAFRLCREAIKLFANDDSPYLIIGEIRLRRFYQDLLARDGKLAKENLEKAFEINPKNYRALLVLAKFYLQIGAVTKAKRRLKDILLFAPEDENIKGFLETAMGMEKPAHEDMDVLLQTVEQKGALFHTLEGTRNVASKVVPSPEVFQDPLNTLRTVPTILCMLVCDEEANLLAHYAQDEVDFSSFYEIASCIYLAVNESSKQMDIGKFQHNQIEGSFGSIHIVAIETIVYIAFGAPNVKAKQVYREVTRFISKIPFHSQGVPYA